MMFNRVIGIGWDVGGWMGSNHGVAICEWNKNTNDIQWKGIPKEISFPDSSLLSYEQLMNLVSESHIGQTEDTLIVIGVDAPLGFPSDFINLLNGQLPSMHKPLKEIQNPLAYRYTDQEIYKVFGKKPLSASFDRIGNNATVAMVHTKKWEKENNFKIYPIREKQEGDNRIIIEVYPALVKESRYTEVFNGLVNYLPNNITPGTDAYDACICALYAIAYGTNGVVLPKLEEPTEQTDDLVKQEGWIYYFKELSIKVLRKK